MRCALSRGYGLLMVLALAMGCSDDSAATDSGVKPDSQVSKEAGAADMGGGLDSKAADAAPDSAKASPDASTACSAKPSGFCKGSEPACSWSGQICKCLSVCSGQKPPPGKEYSWICSSPPPASCPAVPPKTGESCSPSGLKCVYGHCPATRAECKNGKWTVKTDPLPP